MFFYQSRNILTYGKDLSHTTFSQKEVNLKTLKTSSTFVDTVMVRGQLHLRNLNE